MNRIILAALLAFAVTSTGVASATLIQSGNLNIIDDAGNPSNGLRFLDMTFSIGLTEAAALANAQATYADARLATPAEFTDLFAAAGVAYSSSYTAADGFTTGPSIGLTASGDAGVELLLTTLGLTFANGTIIWTDPDDSNDEATTRDIIYLKHPGAEALTWQTGITPSWQSAGWLLVSEVPEPSTFSMVALGTLLLGLRRRRAAVG
jgi:hypothetical protein